MATTSKKVYLAKSSFIAFVDRGHGKHDQATAYFRYFAQEEYFLYTDFLTITAVYDAIAKDISPSLAKDFLRTMMVSDINLVYPDESDIKAGLKALLTYRSTELTFQEAVMAVLANKRSVSQICTLDYLHPLFGQAVFYLPI